LEPDSAAVKTARGSVELIGQGMANIFLRLFFFIVLARMISKAEMGVYAALNMSYSLFQIIGSLGLNFAAARFVPKFLAEGNGRDASAVARRLIEISVASGIALTFIFYVSAPYLSFGLTKSLDYLEVFQVCSFVVLTVVPMIVLDVLLRGVQEFGRLAIVRVLGQILKMAISLPLLLLGYGLYDLAAGLTTLGVWASLLFLSAWKATLASIVMFLPVVGIQIWRVSILLTPVYLTVGTESMFWSSRFCG